jgi:hypothetical protein
MKAHVNLNELAGRGVNMAFINEALSKASATPTEAKPAKHRNTKTVIDGWTFDSKKEARRYLDLRAEQQDRRISELRCQVVFPLVVNGVEVCVYVADFVYLRNGVRVIEDVKSKHTRKLPDYRIKLKLMAALGQPITEVV